MPRPAYLNIVFNQQKVKVWQSVHGINDSEIQIPTRLVSSVDTDAEALYFFIRSSDR